MTAAARYPITRLTPGAFDARVGELAQLLTDVVAAGASLGFLAPFDRAAAEAWWRTRRAAVSDGGLTVWLAHGPDGVAGTISLALGRTPNGRHRAEIVKLMVHPGARGHGLGHTLLATAEHAAVQAGFTLLLLDTVTGSTAERLYRAAGWTRYGIVPGYASDPAEALEDCSFFYKRLG